jgi:stage II sporulation protein AA (anti-sigma F factor antagonist)
MSIKYKKLSNNLIVYLYGEIDEYSAKNIRSRLDEIINSNCDVNNFTFDLSAVSFMDSTGIGMFLGRYKKLINYNINVYITGVTPNIDKILELSGIYRLMKKI